MLKETKKFSLKHIETPVDAQLDLEGGSLIEDIGLYQRLVGRLIYFTITRSDISYVVGLISQFMHFPKTIHLNLVNKILRYLKCDPGKGILMRKNDNFEIIGYLDADWAGYSIDRRSTTRYYYWW